MGDGNFFSVQYRTASLWLLQESFSIVMAMLILFVLGVAEVWIKNMCTTATAADNDWDGVI